MNARWWLWFALCVAFGCSTDSVGGGCATDSDCKGDRICSDGMCISPSSEHSDAGSRGKPIESTDSGSGLGKPTNPGNDSDHEPVKPSPSDTDEVDSGNPPDSEGESSDSSDESSAGSGEPGSSGEVGLGEYCEVDADCAEGRRCLPPLELGYEGYCTQPCEVNEDCKGLAQTSYVIEVPLQVSGFLLDPAINAWKTSYLERGTACVGVEEGSSMCGFACPNLSAMAFDEEGTYLGCKCLPGYVFDDAAQECVLDDSYQCSLFSMQPLAAREQLKTLYGIETQDTVCDACNSDMSQAESMSCHTGRFMCSFTHVAFNGQCKEVVTYDELTGCLEDRLYTDCSCNCPTPDACAGDWKTGFTCSCCECTTSVKYTQPPVCGAQPATNTDTTAPQTSSSGPASSSSAQPTSPAD